MDVPLIDLAGVLLFFVFVPFLTLDCLPLFLISLLVRKVSGKTIKSKIVTKTFIMPAVILAFFAYIFWSIFIRNHIYYEWDYTPLSFTLLSYEKPILDSPSRLNWIANGWSQVSLYWLWFLLVVLVYITSFCISLILNRNNPEWPSYRKFLVVTVSIMTILSGILGAIPTFGRIVTFLPVIPSGYLFSLFR